MTNQTRKPRSHKLERPTLADFQGIAGVDMVVTLGDPSVADGIAHQIFTYCSSHVDTLDTAGMAHNFCLLCCALRQRN